MDSIWEQTTTATCASQYRDCSASTLLLCKMRGSVAVSRNCGFCGREQHKHISLILKHERGTLALLDCYYDFL